MSKEKYIVNLESNRLVLRNIIENDRPFLMNLWTDPEVTQYMGGPRDQKKMDALITEMVDDPYLEEYDLWILIDKTNNQPIGHCGLLEKEVEGNKEIEVTYVLAKDAWHKGYGTEVCQLLLDYAFGEKALQRVIALIKPDNKGSETVALKCGMSLEKEILRDKTTMYLYSKGK